MSRGVQRANEKFAMQFLFARVRVEEFFAALRAIDDRSHDRSWMLHFVR
jgi:hypothetical protein